MTKQLTEEQIDAIFENEITLDDLMHTAPFLLAVLNNKGHLVRLNPLWEDVIGFSVEEIRNTPFIEFVHPEDRDRTMKAYMNGEIFNKELPAVGGFINRYKVKTGGWAILEWYSTGKNVKGHNLGFAIFRGYE